jgi:hypothetical protein
MSTPNIEFMLAPRDGAVESVTVGTSATAAAALATSKVAGATYTGIGPGYYVFEAIGGDIAVVFGGSSCGAPALSGTSKNSETIPQGQTRGWWITDTHYRAIASAASCTLSYRRSSP